MSFSLRQLITKNGYLIIALVFSLLITWKIIGQANSNQLLKGRADEKKAQIRLLEQQIKKLRLDQEFYQSDYYSDLAQREQQGYILPEETVLILDEKTIQEEKKTFQQPSQAPQAEQKEKESAWQQWQRFMFGNN